MLVVSAADGVLRNAAMMHELWLGSARLDPARLGRCSEGKEERGKKKPKGNKTAINFNCLCFGSRRQHEEHVLADDTGQPLRGQHQRRHAEVGVLLHAGGGLGKPLRALRDRSVSTPAVGRWLAALLPFPHSFTHANTYMTQMGGRRLLNHGHEDLVGH